MYKSVIKKKKKNLKDKSRRYVLWLQKPAWRPDGSTWLNREASNASTASAQ